MAQERRQENRRRTGRGRRVVVSTSLVLLYVAFVIGVSVLLATVGWVAANDVLALDKEYISVEVTVSSTDTFDDVVETLEEEGLVEYGALFKLFASITGGESKVSRGTYTLNTDMDYSALLSGMSATADTRATVTVTIPEGYTVAQIFELLDAKGVATVEELNETAANYDFAFDFLQDIPLGEPTRLEGYLFPDTYEFYTPNSSILAINKMLVNTDSVLDTDMREMIEETGYSIYEVLTMASMIEKETDGTDRTSIASVIYNRLNNVTYETVGLLQIDATIYYVTGEEVTQYDRENLDSPYNTHINAGLPAGPIANPGLSSIMAVVNPAQTNYYYYALGDDGLHHYYTTYAEFQAFLSSQERYQ